ncbi:MAG: PAS domain-containing protein [Alphaproteobacteria bacterium]|nr:PAS domain-containing protein [Alphaproteobacteria bacterium]MDE2493973.1 PAS domain-containing protein [Alphaproteobacteria bacterium]
MDSSNQKLAALKTLWERKRGDRAMPSRADLDVAELKPWLGNLALVDLNGPEDGAFRLCGILLFSRFGGDVTGRNVAALSDEIGTSIRAYIARIQKTKSPADGRPVCITNGQRVTFVELALPLSDCEYARILIPLLNPSSALI